MFHIAGGIILAIIIMNAIRFIIGFAHGIWEMLPEAPPPRPKPLKPTTYADQRWTEIMEAKYGKRLV